MTNSPRIQNQTGWGIINIFKILAAMTTPPITNACFYGIDTSNRGELVAARLSIEEIRREIEADTLGYLDVPGLIEALGLPRQDLCLACLTGAYPTETPTETTAGRFALEPLRVVSPAPASQQAAAPSPGPRPLGPR